MASQASPKAGRKKVRCPKCTALFSEPNKAVFECPICACRLSANGANALMESPSHQAREGGPEYRTAVLSNDEPNQTESPMDFVRKEGKNGMLQEGKPTDFEQDSMAYHGQGYKEREQQPIIESFRVLNNGNADGQPSVDNTIEATHGRDGSFSPTHLVSKPGSSMDKEERGESPPPFSVGANEEAALGSTTGQHSSDDSPKENSEESSLIAAGEEGIEKQDCVISGVSSNRHLQSQMFRTTRCEFSFKYTLEGASPLQSNGELHRKKSSNAEASVRNADASDMPLHTPLRVRISKSHEESSDPSEHGGFGFDTDSDDTSGSDFDFPAPWAEGLQDIVLPAPFSQNEAFHPNLEAVVSAAPHQLELQDVDEILDHEEFTLQEESGKSLKVHDTKLPSQVENAGITIDSEECVSMEPPNEVLLLKDGMPKLNGSGLQECSADGEEQDAGFIENSPQDQLRNVELLMNVIQLEAHAPLDVLMTSDSRQASNMKDYGNRTQESIHTGSTGGTNSATLPIQEHFRPYQSAPNLNHTDYSEKTHNILCADGCQMLGMPKNISNTDGRQMLGPSEKDNIEMSEGLLSSMLKSEHSNDVADVKDARMASRPVLSDTVDAELEQDLYKLPHEIYRNDLHVGKSSHSALWVEEESALSNDAYISTSKPKLYHEKRNSQKALYGKNGKLHGNLGSRAVARSDNGGDQFMMPGGEARNSRWAAPSTSREASLQALSEHVDWEGHISSAEDQSNHGDLYEVKGNPGSHLQFPMNNSLGFPTANPQAYALANPHYGFAASGTSQIYSYQLPAQPLMHSAAFQNHALSHCGYHAMSSACMLCSYHQHPHLPPQHIPHCGACCSPHNAVGYNPGLVEHWSCHQADFGSASSCAGSLVDYPQARSSAIVIQNSNFPNADLRSRASSAKKYPPYPKSGAMPYVACKGCNLVLQVPSDFPPNEGIMQKLRCGACGKVTKFSAKCYAQHEGVVSNTLPLELASMGGAANRVGPHSVHNKQLQISSPTEIIKSSYGYDMIEGNSILHASNAVSLQTNNTAVSRIFEQNPQGEEFRRVQPRGQAMEASSNAYGHLEPSMLASTAGTARSQNASGMVVGGMSPRDTILRPTDSFGFERSKANPAASYHLSVDEKDEGLDFGAPRISDGDSMDHSESRMRSPEYQQAGRESPHGDISHPAAHPLVEQVSDGSEDHDTAAPRGKQPGSPLLVLLNQASTRFRLNLEPRGTFAEAKPAMWSPASDSAVYANSHHNALQKGEQDNPRPQGSPGHHFVSKGPRYIAGLLRRSLRDFGKGGGQ